MPPSVAWGLGVGLVIAAIDTLSVVLAGMDGTSQWPIADINFMANIALYSLVGFRVGQATGVVRDAAESGVMAGVVVGLIAIAVTLLLRPATGGIASTSNIVGVMAQNIAIGGVLAILTGWMGTRANPDRPAPRR